MGKKLGSNKSPPPAAKKQQRRKKKKKKGRGAGPEGGVKSNMARMAAAKKRKKGADGAAADVTCHLLRCAEGSVHTGSVAVRRVEVVEGCQCGADAETCTGADEGAGKGGNMKVKKKKKKRPRTTVVSSSDLPPPPPPPPLPPPRPFVDSTSPSTPATPAPTPAMRMVVHVQPLLVLDLNGVLCRRIRYNEQLQAPPAPGVPIPPVPVVRYRPPVGHAAGTPVVTRTDLHPFLTYLDSNFTLAVWTSAKRRTARALVDMLFPEEIARRLLFVWGQNRCDATKVEGGANPTEGSESVPDDDGHDDTKDDTDAAAAAFDDAINDASGQYTCSSSNNTSRGINGSSDNVVFVKSLSKVWSAYPLWDESNTLLIDDSPEKAPVRYRRNTLHPPPILGTVAECCSGLPTNADDRADQGTDGPSSLLLSSDEANQAVQAEFFRSLAEFWRSTAAGGGSSDERGCGDNNKHNLLSFLEGCSCRDHMGWRGVIS